MSGSKRPGKPHIMLGGDPRGAFGLGVPIVTADDDVAAQRIGKASHWMRERTDRFRAALSRVRGAK